MLSFLNGSIRKTIIIIVSLAIVPPLAMAVYSGIKESQAKTKEQIPHVINLVQALGEKQADHLETARLTMLLLSETLPAPAQTLPETTTVLKKIVKNNAYYLDLMLADGDGHVLASGAGTSNLRASEKKLLQQAMAMNAFAVGAMHTFSTAGPGIYAAYPLKQTHNNKPLFFISSILISNELLSYNHELLKQATFSYIDAYGKAVLATPLSSGLSFKKELEDSPFDLVANKASPSGSYLLAGANQNYTVAYQHLYADPTQTSPYLSILLLMPKSTWGAKFLNFLTNDGLLLFFALLLALAVAIFLSSLALARPLKLLVKTAQSFGKGEFNARADLVNFGGEIKTLANSFNHMAVALEVRNQQLLAAKKAADAGSLAKTRFLANMSHEIRTPMNAIIGLAYLTLQTKLDPKQYAYVSKIHTAANSLLRIINDILDFSKMEAGKLKLESAVFEIDDVFSNISDLLEQQAKHKGLNLEFLIADNVPQQVVGDSLRLGQVIINLAANAIKFTEKGTVSISCEVEALSANSVNLLFKVTDTGIGMTSEQQANLFKPFTQADSSTTRRFGGTGLGLIISKYILELMQGNITVDSSYGFGTTVSVSLSLPLPQDEGLENTLLMFKSMEDLPVLIAESENDPCRAVLAEMLERLATRLSFMQSGKDVLNFFTNLASGKNKSLHLLVLNWQQPDINGTEILTQIRKMNLQTQPLIIILLTPEQRSLYARLKESGADAVLCKPLSASLLYNTLQDIFQKKGTSATLTNANAPTCYAAIDLSGCKILLAEDNEINQQVAMELLKSKGAEVDLAENGEEAVQQVKNRMDIEGEKYDLILMDLQMPVMDGYEATRQIRQDGRFDGLPILAMTAHTLQEEYTRCQEAGMDDHISKPIDVNTFFATLGAWLNKNVCAPAAQQPNPALAPDNPAQALQALLPGVNVPEALARAAGSPVLYKQMLNRFRLSYRNSGQNLAEMLDLNQREEATMLVHSLKGLAGNLGLENLFNASKNLEEYLRSDTSLQYASQEDLIQNFLTELQDTIELLDNFIFTERELQTSLPEYSDQTEKNTSSEQDKAPETNHAKAGDVDFEKLLKLEDLLQNGDSEAQSVFSNLELQLAAAMPRQTFAALKNMIELFEFDDALELLQKNLPRPDDQ